MKSGSDDRQERAAIAAYLDASTPVPRAVDLLFVPGTRLQQPAVLAAELLLEGVAPWVAVTGGKNRETGLVEADALRVTLLDRGIAESRVIVERSSTNTLQNVTQAWPLIVDATRTYPVKSVLAICKWMHSRRVLMTLKANLPPGLRYYALTYDPEGVTRSAWVENPNCVTATGDAMRNWRSISTYLERGDLTEVRFDGEAYV